MIDRLLLTEERIADIIKSIKDVAKFKDPVGEVYDCRKRHGLKICKKRVPLGVIGIIYESRPNVTVDVVSLCLKSGNAVILKGGEESDVSNKALVKIIRGALKKAGLSEDAVILLDSFDRSLVKDMLRAHEFVDLIIPRGGEGLINFVRKESEVPMIETGAGVCHTYVDWPAEARAAARIVFNAKTQRPTVCNALDTLLIHKKSLEILPGIARKLLEKGVEIRADARSYKVLKQVYPRVLLRKAKPSDFGHEFLSMKMAVKVVDSFDEALQHIQENSSGHSEAIITKNKKHAERFLKEVDAAAVYVNTSTRFTDGGVFGLGAEIGISTQKLHARGPMGLGELTTYKWVIYGKGQARK